MKKRFRSLEGEYADLLELFHMLKHRPKADAYSILDRIRAGDDFRDTLAFIKEGDLLTATHLLTPGKTNASLLPSPRSRVEGFMNITHPIAYPPLAPLNDPAAGLGEQRTSLMEVSPEEVEEQTGHPAKKARCVVLQSHLNCSALTYADLWEVHVNVSMIVCFASKHRDGQTLPTTTPLL
jgi:hypothetical protein